MRVEDLGTAIGVMKIMPLIRTMIERGIIIMDEELRERFRPKTSNYINFAPEYRTEAAQQQLLAMLEKKRSVKQVEVLLQVAQLTHFGREAVAKRMLPQGSPLQTLLRHGYLCTEERIESRLAEGNAEPEVSPDSIVLNTQQQAALDALRSAPQQVSLLHGVTASGKTEVYIRLMAEVISQGGQVLFLLPEIALTTQVINRLRRYFGSKVGVYHSRFSTSQRVEVWNRTLSAGSDGLQVILGARSALLLPFRNLKLIVIDEEHDTSYKQQDPAPRYHARDAAIYLATRCNARVVLGSATPSIESFYNAQIGKYGLATITERYGGVHLPDTQIVDMRQAHKDGMVRGLFSQQLLNAIGDALQPKPTLGNTTLPAKRQVILYQNRRGFSQRIECDDCHHTPQCIHCDVSLVYHKATASLRCHYCGYSIPVPQQCPACGSTRLRTVGVGTERIEDDLRILFPNAVVERLDLDSTSQKNRYQEILHDFAQQKIDILVGTQMVTKGLDFERVGVVGVVSADSAITFPNFRSFERAFQQLTQVSGRAGRHGDQGHVLIQTYNPQHQVLQNVISNDYHALFEEQIQERRIFRYPPYYRFIQITLKHREADLLDAAAAWMAAHLRATFGNRVMGPEYPLVSRVRALYLKQITLRFEASEPISDAKRVLLLVAEDMQKEAGWSTVSVHFDVDPY